MHTIRDLIDSLERLAAQYDDDTQPRLATMGLHAPMEYLLADVDVVEVDREPDGSRPRHVLYLVAENSGERLAFEAQRVFRG